MLGWETSANVILQGWEGLGPLRDLPTKLEHDEGLDPVSRSPQFTVRGIVPVAPIGVVTLTVSAPAVRVQVVFTVVDVDALTVHELPVPDTVTAVAPARFVPVSVSRIPAPCVTGFGVTELRVGPRTVNV